MKPQHWLPLTLAILLTAIVPQSRADTLQLTNGDTLNGEVLTLDANEVKLKSEVLGEVVIARDKVVNITLGDRRPRTPKDIANDDSVLSSDVNKQLDSLGIDSKKATELLKRFGVTTKPEGNPKAIHSRQARTASA